MLLVLLAGAGLGSSALDAAPETTYDELRQLDAARAAGDIDTLVALVSRGSEHARGPAAWSLATSARRSGTENQAIARAGAIEPLVALVSGDNTAAPEAAAAALCVLAFDADNQVRG